MRSGFKLYKIFIVYYKLTTYYKNQNNNSNYQMC